jgi:hypothetical protein
MRKESDIVAGMRDDDLQTTTTGSRRAVTGTDEDEIVSFEMWNEAFHFLRMSKIVGVAFAGGAGGRNGRTDR